MKILEYQVHFKYNSNEPTEVKKFYTTAAAKSHAASVELWGGVAVIVEEIVEEGEVDGIH